MATICSQCGTEIPDGSNGCPACGFGALSRLKLEGSLSAITTSLDLDFTKTLGAKICGEDSKFMDEIQFLVKFRDEKWYIKPYPRVRNEVFLNGSKLETVTELNDGDKLSLKDKALFIDVKTI